MPEIFPEAKTPIRVLVVEDSAADAELIIAALRGAGFSVEFELVDTSEAFLDKLNDGEFHLILSDHNLINWNGRDALFLLHRSGRDIPFIVVTGSLGDEIAVGYVKDGATDYVLKNHLDRLPAVAARALREKAQHDENTRLQEQRAQILSELRESESQLRTLVQTIPDLIWMKDLNGAYLGCNAQFELFVGKSSDEIIGKDDRDLISQQVADAHAATDQKAIATGLSIREEEWMTFAGSGYCGLFETITKRMTDEAGRILGVVGIARDVTTRHEASLEIERLAFYDQLTLLPNRRLLIDRLQRSLLNCKRFAYAGAVFFIDIDNFKMLNDTLGHGAGDALLIEVARRLSGCIRDNDTVGRLGGDEFVIVIEGMKTEHCSAIEQAMPVGEKILSAVCRPYDLAGTTYHVSASIGLTSFDSSSPSVEEIMKQADIAMYQAKASGRQSLRAFSPATQASISARAQLEQDLRAGIEREEFALHYQPQVDTDGNVVGAEALLRWNHPVRGMVLPDQFVDVAEETGLILPIGEWVLKTACRQLVGWSHVPGLDCIAVAINVSARQFRQEDFVARVQHALRETGADPDHLTVELTESMLISDIITASQKMDVLKGVGVRVSIDDFGTGFSSLSYLTRFPLDQLKIDRSFIHNLPESSADANVVQAILTLGNSLGVIVVAEGVETESQHSFLHDRGCPTFQGYLYGCPMDVAQFEQRVLPAGSPAQLVQ